MRGTPSASTTASMRSLPPSAKTSRHRRESRRTSRSCSPWIRLTSVGAKGVTTSISGGGFSPTIALMAVSEAQTKSGGASSSVSRARGSTAPAEMTAATPCSLHSRPSASAASLATSGSELGRGAGVSALQGAAGAGCAEVHRVQHRPGESRSETKAWHAPSPMT